MHSAALTVVEATHEVQAALGLFEMSYGKHKVTFKTIQASTTQSKEGQLG